MRPGNDCTSTRGKVEARGDTKTPDRSVPHPVAEAQAGKALAVMLYNVGARSIGETQAAFDRRPTWRHA